MRDIYNIIKRAKDDLFPQLEAKIRSELENKDKDWLIDQIIYLTCEKHGLHEQKNNLLKLKARLDRIKNLNYIDKDLIEFIEKYKKTKRQDLELLGYIIDAPHRGLDLIEPSKRSKEGEELLQRSKDLLYVALYGDTSINVKITRNQEEILTLVLPEGKKDTFTFLKAATEIKCNGTWKDPESISNDEHSNNIELQVEFNDNEQGVIGTAILVALNLINLLQINEEILYARLEKVQRSSLQSL